MDSFAGGEDPVVFLPASTGIPLACAAPCTPPVSRQAGCSWSDFMPKKLGSNFQRLHTPRAMAHLPNR